MPHERTRLISEALAIFRKDLRSELRSKVAVNSIMLFSLITLTLVSYSIGPYRIPPEDKPAILAAWLTIVLFFASMTGLSRAFVKEEESRTADSLRMAAEPNAVFMGKLLINVVVMAGVTLIVVPLFNLLMASKIEHAGSFSLIVALSMLGLTIASTLVAAIISKASMKGALFPILAFPILLPILLEASSALGKASVHPDLSFLPESLGVLVSYSGMTFIAGVVLFDKVWKA
jgi:heme exporter protein B